LPLGRFNLYTGSLDAPQGKDVAWNLSPKYAYLMIYLVHFQISERYFAGSFAMQPYIAKKIRLLHELI